MASTVFSLDLSMVPFGEWYVVHVSCLKENLGVVLCWLTPSYYLQVTPFYTPGSAGAAKGKYLNGLPVGTTLIHNVLSKRLLQSMLEAATGVFRAAPPFAAWKSIPSNAVLFGSILGVQRVSSKTCEFIRGGTVDMWNELFGFGVTYKYYQTFLGTSEKRLARHNCLVGGAVAMSILYASLFA